MSTNRCPCWLMPWTTGVHAGAAQSARTRSGTAAARARNIAHWMYMETRSRPPSGAGWVALRMLPSGALTRSGCRVPPLIGESGAQMQISGNTVSAYE